MQNSSWSLTRADSIVGYWVNNSLSITIRQLDTAGQVLQAAIEAGANSISGLTFTLGDPEPVKDSARALAVADARNRADVLADAAGVRVGKVLAIREVSLSLPPIFRGGAADEAASGQVPVEPFRTDGVNPLNGNWSYEERYGKGYALQYQTLVLRAGPESLDLQPDVTPEVLDLIDRCAVDGASVVSSCAADLRAKLRVTAYAIGKSDDIDSIEAAGLIVL